MNQKRINIRRMNIWTTIYKWLNDKKKLSCSASTSSEHDNKSKSCETFFFPHSRFVFYFARRLPSSTLLWNSLLSKAIMLLILSDFFSTQHQAFPVPDDNRLYFHKIACHKSDWNHLYDMNNLFDLCWNACERYMFLICWVFVVAKPKIFIFFEFAVRQKTKHTSNSLPE
jgi:hypothetical protein